MGAFTLASVLDYIFIYENGYVLPWLEHNVSLFLFLNGCVLRELK